eukprot:s313_g2.t1
MISLPWAMGNAKEENNPCVVRKQNIVLPIQTWNLGAKVDGMKLPQEAVENVTKAVEEEVRREAYAAAERRAAEPTPSPEALRAAKKVEAEEPYRQAVERAQQSAALSMAKSQRAAEAVNRLAEESQALAKKAQALQEKGEALPAQHAMIEAHQRMKQVYPASFHDGRLLWMTELEEGGFWAGFSPYCLKSALPPENSPTLVESNLRLRWIRIYWWVFLLLVYSALLLESNANRELSSGVRYEIIEQLFPDWNKASERTRDAEVSPSLKIASAWCLWPQTEQVDLNWDGSGKPVSAKTVWFLCHDNLLTTVLVAMPNEDFFLPFNGT